MPVPRKVVAIGAAALLTVTAVPLALHAFSAQPPVASPLQPQTHRVVIQISEDDPKAMNVALNNAENLNAYFKARNEPVQIEFVAYGPGLTMVRSDTSPVKERLLKMSSMKNITFSGCGNTLEKASKLEGRQISLVPEAHLVPTGIARIVQLEEEGWTYVRP